MISINLPNRILYLIEYIKGLHPCPESIWLIGSQVNGTATNESDWDILVFGSEELISTLKAQISLDNKLLDILVVYDGNNFLNPFRKKKGSLTDWNWKKVSQDCATYCGSKWIPNEEESKRLGSTFSYGDIQESECKGVRVF